MKLIHINKVYHNKNNDVQALKDISFELNENGIIVLLGSSGSGKSTLLNIISGQDKDFTGQIEDLNKIDYITQEFNLFEDMSIMDNLLMACSDKQQILEYIHLFALEPHIYKKVKKLSNGQKRRVQFIRALLQNPDVLLCDEPTAALDHENSVLLMEELKKISDNVLIFMVTHDIALANSYADRIIQIEKGMIKEDTIIHRKEKHEKNKIENVHKSLMQHLRFSLKQIKSRKFETAFYVLLSFIICISMFISLQIYTNVDNQTYVSTVWENGFNQVQSLPKEQYQVENKMLSRTCAYEKDGVGYGCNEQIIYGHYPQTYVSFDVLRESDIQNVVENVDEIIAVSPFYDYFLYETIMKTVQLSDVQREVFRTNQTRYRASEDTELHDYTLEPGFYPFLMSEAEFERLFEENQSTIEYLYELQYIDDEGNYFTIRPNSENISYVKAEYMRRLFRDEAMIQAYSFKPYEIVNEYQLPLIYGTMPKAADEVVVGYNTAEAIRRFYNYSTLEEMIGEKIEIAVPSQMLQYSATDDYIMTFIDLTVSGITPLQNEEMRVYFQTGGIKETLLKDRINEGSEVYYTAVDLLIDPNSDYPAVIEEMNQHLPFENNELVLASEQEDQNNEAVYMNPRSFFVYCNAIALCLALVYIIYLLMNKKRGMKEKNILITYNYNVWIESAIRYVLIEIAVLTLVMLCTPTFVNYMNQIAKSLYYDNFLTENYLLLAGILLVLTGFCLSIENLMWRRRK